MGMGTPGPAPGGNAWLDYDPPRSWEPRFTPCHHFEAFDS